MYKPSALLKKLQKCSPCYNLLPVGTAVCCIGLCYKDMGERRRREDVERRKAVFYWHME